MICVTLNPNPNWEMQTLHKCDTIIRNISFRTALGGIFQAACKMPSSIALLLRDVGKRFLTLGLARGLSCSSFLAAASMAAAAPSSSFSAMTVGSSGSTHSVPRESITTN